MTKQLNFYIIEKNTASISSFRREVLACDLAAQAWRLGKYVLIVCDNENQKHSI